MSKITDVSAAYDKQFEKVDLQMMSHIEIEYVKTLRELAEVKAEVVRLKGEAESWEKVFDKTCQHLADAKTKLAAMKEGK